MPRSEWTQAQADGKYRGSAVDLQDGYIHFSTAAQVAETAAKHFAGQNDLVLLEFDESLIGDLSNQLKWEPSRGGELFPHLYESMPVKQVVSTFEMPIDANGQHVLPAHLTI